MLKGLKQLASLERRTGSGKDSIDHPRGCHDDIAASISGAIVLAFECNTDEDKDFYFTR